MSDVERVLIGSVQRGKTKSGKETVELYSTDTRLEYPVLILFDLSMLETVGIDANDLDSERVHKRFWAYYTESEKTTSRGNPYRDIQYLEPIDTPATTTSTDNSALLAELRAIRGLLQALVGNGQQRKPVPRSVNLGQGDENAEWIADAETRAEEQSIHDQIQSDHDAAGNPDTELDEFFPRDEPELPAGTEALAEAVGEITKEAQDLKAETALEIPTSGANDMVAYLNRTYPKIQCQSAGHLAYVLKKVDPNWQGWPISTDQEGWRQVAAIWAGYWEAIA